MYPKPSFNRRDKFSRHGDFARQGSYPERSGFSERPGMSTRLKVTLWLLGSFAAIAGAGARYAQTGGLVQLLDSAGVNRLSISSGGAAKVDASATTQPVSQSGTWTVQPGNTANTTAWKVDGSAVTQPTSLASLPALAAGTNTIGDVNLTAAARGGYSIYFANALKATVQTVSSSAGKFAGCTLINTDSAPVYLQCFDTTGTVTLGTTTPTFVIPFPANSTAANGIADRLTFDVGVTLSNGLKVAATTTATGSTASANGLTGSIFYK